MSERLEDIKNRFSDYKYDFNLRTEDIDWLIKQAERVEELEKINYDLKSLYIHLEKTTERYKQALEFYADENNYREHDLKGIVPPRPIAYKPILHDYGSIARQALERDEN